MANWIKKLTSAFSGPADNRLPFEKDRDRLFQAVQKNDLKKVDELSSRYSDEIAEWKTKKGSLLNIAQSHGHLEAFKLLVAHGANINDNYGAGITPLMRAIKKGQNDFAVYAIEHGANLAATGIGARYSDPYSDDDYYTALHFAVKKGNRDIVLKLLEHGADPHQKTSAGTPITFAEGKKEFAICDLMKRADKIRADYLEKNKPAPEPEPEPEQVPPPAVVAASETASEPAKKPSLPNSLQL